MKVLVYITFLLNMLPHKIYNDKPRRKGGAFSHSQQHTAKQIKLPYWGAVRHISTEYLRQINSKRCK